MSYQDELAYKRAREQDYRTLRAAVYDATMEERHAALSAFEATTQATLDSMRNQRRIAARNRSRFKQYGLTPEAYEALQAAQHGRCAICHKHPERHQLVIDHCHRTGRVRGLLCTRCNTLLGRAHEDVDLLAACITYLSEQ